MIGMCVLSAAGATSCTGEDADPVDFSSTSTSAVADSNDFEIGDIDDGPNAQQNRITLGYAEQQCWDDPELDEGYVQIVDPETNEKVSEVRVDCAELRARPN